ncbi:hypothetical protein ABIA30_005260 [Mycobacterium sp. MAA66]|uniref:DUF4333 domain-containing protein n=1 Tax=Mycobacterium sp. MAA66 TaxID=3156297 RepID=UPI003515065D
MQSGWKPSKIAGVVGVIIVAVLIGTGLIMLGISVKHPSDSSDEPKDKKSTALPMVAKDQLEQTLTKQLTNPDQPPPTVICDHGLIGKVGQSTPCAVTMADSNAFDPIVTVNGVDDANVKFDLQPSISKVHLESAVGAMIKKESDVAPDSVVCDTGLEGKQGFVAICHVTAAGFTSNRTVQVGEVQGLSMHYGLAPALPKPSAEKALMAQLAQIGKHPDTATCHGDLEGRVDNTLLCTVAYGGSRQDYLLTVTGVSDRGITFKYTPQ